MSGKKLLIIALLIFALEVIVLVASNQPNELPDFKDVARINLIKVPEGETTFWTLNRDTTIMMILIDVFLIVSAWLATKKLRDVPDKLQNVFEIIVEVFTELITQTLGNHGYRHIPMLGSLFLYLWISNINGSIPMTAEPTRDLNVSIGHMLVVLFIVHFEAIRVKGIKKYLMSYNEPFFVMLPLNVIGELAKGVSLAFRLFGNILGGAIIVMVISYLTHYLIIPVGLNMFFGIFVGTIQAFVFTMLSMTYMAVAIAD